jgi:hypothetical protein
MRTLCVVTAVKDGNPEWLQTLGESLASVVLPDDWQMIWSVQEDGYGVSGENLPEMFPFCRYERLGISTSIAVARNVALFRVPEADAVVNFDADDIAGQGLATSLTILDENPELVWVAGPVEDLRDDGTTVSFSQLLIGLVEPGEVSRLWWTRQRLPFHTIGFMSRVQPWWFVGGWGSVPTAADSTFGIMALTEFWPGFVHNEVLGWWRRHPAQKSFTDDEIRFQSLSWDMIKARIEAIRQ